MKRGCAPGFDNATARAAFYDPERVKRVRRVYLAELEEFDAMVGSVIDALRAAGRWDADTYVVLSADHGDMCDKLHSIARNNSALPRNLRP